MLKANNFIKIDGILSENNLERCTYVKNGATVNAIRGAITIRVENGNTYDIPVKVFSNELTKDGKPSSAYMSLNDIMNKGKSIAAVGADAADAVHVSGSLHENFYYSLKQEKMIDFTELKGGFVTLIDRSKLVPTNTFDLTFVVGNIADELDSEGVETGRVKVTAITPVYGDAVEVYELITDTPRAAEAVRNNWTKGDTVRANGVINFTYRVDHVVTEQSFGDPIVTARTVNIHELGIRGGSDPLDGDYAIDSNALRPSLEARKVAMNQAKEEAIAKSKPKAADNRAGFDDLGF